LYLRRERVFPGKALIDMFCLPPKLVALGAGLRPLRDDDAPFLLALYKSVRWDELRPTGWPDEVKHLFIADQFRLQSLHYSQAYVGGEFMVIERSGQPIGRLYLYRGSSDHRIVDISLLEEGRGQGIGGTLLDLMCEEAAALSRTVSIHVEKFNPAQSLYERKKFRRIGENGPYWLMQWQSDSAG
jgi:RimJ/RimL family protein N-acetyltransferase